MVKASGPPVTHWKRQPAGKKRRTFDHKELAGEYPRRLSLSLVGRVHDEFLALNNVTFWHLEGAPDSYLHDENGDSEVAAFMHLSGLSLVEMRRARRM